MGFRAGVGRTAVEWRVKVKQPSARRGGMQWASGGHARERKLLRGDRNCERAPTVCGTANGRVAVKGRPRRPLWANLRSHGFARSALGVLGE